jgi:peptide chain release factor subunit 3
VVPRVKKHVNVVFIGHVDAGKSTISGHILFLNGIVDERTLEKYEREAKAKVTSSPCRAVPRLPPARLRTLLLILARFSCLSRHVQCRPQGRESWKYAWALDTTDEERAKGKTQECGRGTFETGMQRLVPAHFVR